MTINAIGFDWWTGSERSASSGVPSKEGMRPEQMTNLTPPGGSWVLETVSPRGHGFGAATTPLGKATREAMRHRSTATADDRGFISATFMREGARQESMALGAQLVNSY